MKICNWIIETWLHFNRLKTNQLKAIFMAYGYHCCKLLRRKPLENFRTPLRINWHVMSVNLGNLCFVRICFVSLCNSNSCLLNKCCTICPILEYKTDKNHEIHYSNLVFFINPFSFFVLGYNWELKIWHQREIRVIARG